jgi:tetratricopeptide (TPR) repeat protein
LAACLFCSTGVGRAWPDSPEGPHSDPLVLDDVLEAPKPQRSRTESEEDRLEALARFSAARMLERQGEDDSALRHYQRALRYDPDSNSVAAALISLAMRLKRPAEAARSALLATRLEGVEPMQLRELGVQLRREGNWEGAVRMYEKALAAREGNEPSAADVVLHRELIDLYYVVEEHPKAADSCALVLDALENPKKYRLNDAIRTLVLGQAEATYGLFGECFLSAKRFEEATALFEKRQEAATDEDRPKKGRLAYDLARVDAGREKPDEALARLETCFQSGLETAGTGPYELLETVLKDLDRKDELLERLEALHAKDSENVPLAYFLAEEYFDAGRPDEAEPLYRQLAAASPTRTGYRRLVEIYRNADRWDELLDVLAEASTRVPSLDALAADDRPISKDAELVATILQTARKRYQSKPEAFGLDHRRAVAMLALDAGQPDAAAEFFELAIEVSAEARVELLRLWGLGLLLQDDYPRSVDLFRRALEEKLEAQDEAAFHFYLASALEMGGRTDEALVEARKAIESDEDSPRFRSRVGWVLFHANRLDEAYQAYAELIERLDSLHEPPEIREVLRETRLVLSNICVLKEEHPEAVEWLQQVLDEFPADVAALNDLGYLWADRGEHLQRAQRMLREAVDEAPDNAAYRDSLGWVLYRLGRLEEAIQELQKAAEMESDPVILDHLGDAYLALGKRDEARQAWQRAVERFTEAKKERESAKVQEKLDRGR